MRISAAIAVFLVVLLFFTSWVECGREHVVPEARGRVKGDQEARAIEKDARRARSNRPKVYSRTVVFHYEGTAEDVAEVGDSIGLQFVRPVIKHFYEFKIPNIPDQSSAPIEIDIKEMKRKYKKLINIEQEEVKFMQKRSKVDSKRSESNVNRSKVRNKRSITINDPEWSNQWNMNGQTPSMYVYESWDKGYTGNDVTIAIVDDGIDTSHSDLSYDASLSYDYAYDVMDPAHVHASDGHGTNCAGVAAALKNSVCVIGVAYNATIAAIRLLDQNIGATSSMEALAITHKLDYVDIYSNSWGPLDNGEDLSPLPDVLEEALKTGVTDGRSGKGAIYVWASGNGGEDEDDCNADGYASSIYTIGINAVSQTGAPTYYAEWCTSAMAGTYSGDDPNPDIYTTGPDDNCVSDFSGTSAACPLAAGIFALTLEANPDLTWRDMHHLIVETANNTGLHSNASVYTNAAGKEVSYYFGFGLLDAEAMVDAAPSWLTVPDVLSCYEFSTNTGSDTEAITDTLSMTACQVAYIEHVSVKVRYTPEWRGNVQLGLYSPGGTEVTLFSARYWDYAEEETNHQFMTVHLWGENPVGDWTLALNATYNAGWNMKLDSWQLTVYGTVTDPTAGAPSAGSLGGACNGTVSCSGYSKAACSNPDNVCVTCSTGFHIYSTYCYQDGRLNGYCDDSTPCRSFSGDLECVDGRCEETSEDDNTWLIVRIVLGVAAVVTIVVVISIVVYMKVKAAKASASVAPEISVPPADTNAYTNPAYS